MHNDDHDGFSERSGLVSYGHWMMPMLWSRGRADKISNKLAGDVACLGGSMVEDQPRLLGSRVRFPAGAFAIFFRFCHWKLHFQFPFPSPFDLSFVLKTACFAFIPLRIIFLWHFHSTCMSSAFVKGLRIPVPFCLFSKLYCVFDFVSLLRF